MTCPADSHFQLASSDASETRAMSLHSRPTSQRCSPTFSFCTRSDIAGEAPTLSESLIAPRPDSMAPGFQEIEISRFRCKILIHRNGSTSSGRRPSITIGTGSLSACDGLDLDNTSSSAYNFPNAAVAASLN
jgi:hypothetical protein